MNKGQMTAAEDKTMIEEFRQFCLCNNLRCRREAMIPGYKNLISPTRSRIFPQDHLFEGFQDHFGVSVVRETSRQLSGVVKHLQKLGCVVTQRGDTECNLKVPKDQAMRVARFLKCTKRSLTGGFQAAGSKIES